MTLLVKTDRLLVSRQDPATRGFTRIGTLVRGPDGYTFTYADGVTRPLPGLPIGRSHQGEQLFPVFAERVIDPHRPERAETLSSLGLPDTAGPFEVLAVSGGRRTGDLYELTPLSQPGPVDLPFLVHGVRHLSPQERAEIDRLDVGERLELRRETDNRANERALLVSRGGIRLGWVPDPLLNDVHAIIGGPHELVVERANPPGAGMHMRLLVRLIGRFEPSG